MATIETKFNVGETVFFGYASRCTHQHPCPDCLGLTKWQAQAPSGQTYEFKCPRCCDVYRSNPDLSLEYNIFEGAVKITTIGSIKFDSEQKEAVSYGCKDEEEGYTIIMQENSLFHTKEKALSYGEKLAFSFNTRDKQMIERYNTTLKLSNFQLKEIQKVDSYIKNGTLFLKN